MLKFFKGIFMQDIQTQVISTYQENMLFFENNFPSLYNKILALDTILSEKKYHQKYDLEYKNGYFDIVELESGELLYKEDSNLISDKQTQEISLKKDDQVFESYRKYFFDEGTINFFNKQSASSDFVNMAPIVNYYNKYIDGSMDMLELNKFIFFGTGLGLHIQKTVEKYNIQVSLIIEDDIELFRLSMFTTNYKNVFQNKDVFFAVALNEQEFHTTFGLYFNKAFMKNLYLKFYVFSQKDKKHIPYVQSKLVSRPEVAYSHNRLLQKNIKVIYKLKNEFKFLNLLKKEDEVFFQNKPILILGAGPSLHNNILWIKENADKFIIITALVSLKTLKNIGISPDIIVQVDENEHMAKEAMKNLGDIEFLKNSICIFTASVSQTLFKTFKNNPIYVHEDRTKYKLAKSTTSLASVGESMYSLALIFNARNIYLLGIDLALGKDGMSHSPDHFRAAPVEENLEKEQNEFGVTNADAIIEVKGNFRDKVQTTPVFAMSIPIMNLKTTQYKSKNQNVYNLSDGAHFLGTNPILSKDVILKDTIVKSELKHDLEVLFDKYSSNQLDEEEIMALECRKGHIEESRNFILEFKEKPYSNIDIFESNFIFLIDKLSNSKCRFELWEILITYFYRVTPYVDDFLNTKKLKNTKKHTKHLRALIIEQLENIVNEYEDMLDELN